MTTARLKEEYQNAQRGPVHSNGWLCARPECATVALHMATSCIMGQQTLEINLA